MKKHVHMIKYMFFKFFLSFAFLLGKTLMGYDVPASVSGASLQTTLSSISENAFSAYKFVSSFNIL